jgi:cytochrome c-type biogenesis protein CcmE
MMPIRAKLIIAGIILLTAVAYLASAGLKSGWVYFLEVDRYLDDPQYRAQRVRLHGKVAGEGFAASSGSLSANFNLLGKTRSLPVSYHGSVPDMFQAGREVVVEGKLNQAGVFQADVLMTKCASKYEPNSPHAGGQE